MQSDGNLVKRIPNSVVTLMHACFLFFVFLSGAAAGWSSSGVLFRVFDLNFKEGAPTTTMEK